MGLGFRQPFHLQASILLTTESMKTLLVLTMVAGDWNSSAVGRLLHTPPPKGAPDLSSPQDL